MSRLPSAVDFDLYPDLRLPVALLSRYLFFLTRRPVSNSNRHFLEQRIRGLKSLAGCLRNAESPRFDEVAERLAALSAVNFTRAALPLRETLGALTGEATTWREDFIVSRNSPGQAWLNGAERVLLALGPGIGVGDEIILFSLPGWLKAAAPQTEITVLSTYNGLWDRVAGVDRIRHYGDLADLLSMLRGNASDAKFDLVILADFERPNLCEAISYEPGVERYLEISLGTHSAYLLDNHRRWLFCWPGLAPYFVNYYSGLNQIARWLGLKPRMADRSGVITRRAKSAVSDDLRVFVSPFTSKYDPSEVYWSGLLAGLFARPRARRVRLLIDTGTNSATGRFAAAVAQSAGARVASVVSLELAGAESKGRLSLRGVFDEMEQADAVVCADSFAAHAAPLFACTTLVLAGAGLENWRVPYGGSFYFRAEDPPEVVAAGMRQALRWNKAGEDFSGGWRVASSTASRLDATTDQLHQLLDDGLRNAEDWPPDDLFRAYEQLVFSHDEFTEELKRWPREMAALLRDRNYSRSMRNLDGDRDNVESLPDLLVYLRDEFEQWRNTNASKFLRLILHGTTGSSGW